MATIGEVLKQGKIDDIETEVHQIASEVGRELENVSDAKGLKLAVSLLKMRFEVDFYRFDLSEMEQKALVAAFCNRYCIVSEEDEYLFELYSSAWKISEVDLRDEESYKLNVTNLGNLYDSYTEDLQFICDPAKISRPWWIPPGSIRYTSRLNWGERE